MQVLSLMTWTTGDSLDERFQSARDFFVFNQRKRRRPGKTVEGFEKALANTPTRIFKALAQAVLARLPILLAKQMVTDGFVLIGCDGSRLECSRTAELEKRLPPGGKERSAPTIWAVVMVHLYSGVPWCWRFGTAKKGEQGHLRAMIAATPKLALIIGDALYMGYETARAIMASKRHFLFRCRGRNTFYVDQDAQTPLKRWRDGLAWYWPVDQRGERGGPPLRVRLIRIRGKKKKNDVWLVTSVLDSTRLTVEMAGRYYRLRWGNECLFSTYKNTLSMVKLTGRTIKTIHREAHASLLATQLLLAQGAMAMPAAVATVPRPTSPRCLVLEVRREMAYLPSGRRLKAFSKRAAAAVCERRERSSPKSRRVWPRRKPHDPPLPPKIRTLTPKQKSLFEQRFAAA